MSPGSAAVVGFVGLGAMGSPMSRHLLEAGWTVYGTDPAPQARQRFTDAGGVLVSDPAEVARSADVVVTSLPHLAAVRSVVAGEGGLAEAGRRVAVVETSTLALDDKAAVRDLAAEHGLTLYDCPVSGTSAQAENKDLVAYLSGDDDPSRSSVAAVLDDMTRRWFDLGAFGAGTKMKLVANLLVAVHNLAAAEALLLAERAGLDLDAVLAAVGDGAGTSRMLQVRGPLMATRAYADTVTATVDVFTKDLRAISDLARGSASPTPLFNTTEAFYEAARAQGRGAQDTACVHGVLETLAPMG